MKIIVILFIFISSCAQLYSNPERIDETLKAYKKASPLQYVTLAGNIEKLLRDKINLNDQTSNKSTLLIELSKDPSPFIPPLITKLLKGGANPLAKDSTGLSSLAYATQNGSAETMQLLLDFNAYSLADAQEKNIVLSRAQDEVKKNLIKEENLLLDLFDAVSNNNNQVMQTILKNPLTPNIINAKRVVIAHGRSQIVTPLLSAVLQDNADMIKNLVSAYRNSIDINATDAKGLTPLMVALSNKKYDAAQALLLFKPDVRKKDKDATSALQYLFKYYPLNKKAVALLLEPLLQVGADPNEVINKKPVLNIALSNSSFDQSDMFITKILLQYGANPNNRDNNNNTALFTAVSALGQNQIIERVVDLLVKKGAIITAINNNNQTVFDIAPKSNVSLQALLKQYTAPSNAKIDTLYKLVKMMYAEYIVHDSFAKEYEKLLKSSEDNPAARRRLAQTIDGLKTEYNKQLERDAKTLIAQIGNLIDTPVMLETNDLTPLMAAALRNRSSLIEKLLTAGAQINIQNNKGQTALMLAVERQNKDAVEQLLAVPGINLNLQDNDGYTPLMMAGLSPRLFDLIPKFIAKGARIDLVNKDGKTAPEISLSPNIQWYGKNEIYNAAIHENENSSRAEVSKHLANLTHTLNRLGNLLDAPK